MIEQQRVSEDGKKDWVGITPESLDELSIMQFVKSEKAGAVSSFLGTTRDLFEGKVVTHLEYEAYDDMAISTMLSICDKIRSKWSVMHIAMQHKLGPCPVLQTSVAIAISSEHRKDGLEAVHFAIDELKATVPIWKKECYADGDSTWKENALPPSPGEEERGEESSATSK